MTGPVLPDQGLSDIMSYTLPGTRADSWEMKRPACPPGRPDGPRALHSDRQGSGGGGLVSGGGRDQGQDGGLDGLGEPVPGVDHPLKVRIGASRFILGGKPRPKPDLRGVLWVVVSACGLYPERCQSGRSGRSRKPVWEQSYRGFESLPLRSLQKGLTASDEKPVKEV